MTPNEARQVLRTYPIQAKRRDVLGRIARKEIREAYRVLARHSLDVAGRMRSPGKRAAYQQAAGFYREAAANVRV